MRSIHSPRKTFHAPWFLSVLVLCTQAAIAQPPPGYYDTVDLSSVAALRASLHAIVDDHQRFPYTSTATDTWDILETADENPLNPSEVLDVYRNATHVKMGGGTGTYNREHTWPSSFGFPNDNSTNYPYTDCHALFLSDSGYNSSRSNKPFRYCTPTCLEKVTEANGGVGGGSGTYPGNSNWTSGSGASGSWETWIDRRGDVARALLYLDVRYEGGIHGVTGHGEPDLILTDSEALIAGSSSGSNESVAYMGILSVLLQWHQEDPVDDKERARNNAVAAYQGNRNPFIDHPDWVACVFSGSCGAQPPSAPTGVSAVAGDAQVDLDWSSNPETDIDGYNVYRSTTSGGPYSQLSVALLTSPDYTDLSVSNGTTYWYVVTAVNTSGLESNPGAEVSATPMSSAGPTQPWINEFHYDDRGGDNNEFVEIAGPTATDLSGWKVLGYNGSNGTVYATINLSGTLPDDGGCRGTLSFPFTGMQNGSPDGLALIDSTGAVIEFISYEGSLLAANGEAAGLTSTDIGVAETNGTPNGSSLQRSGVGSQGSDFTWQAPQPHTSGTINAGQAFTGCGPADTTPPAAPTGLIGVAGNGHVSLSWIPNSEPDLDGYRVYRAPQSGGPHTELTTQPEPAPIYVDITADNGITYWYVVTAVDTSGNESEVGNETSATPFDTTPPAQPADLTATGSDGQVLLDWSDNGESDLDGYNLFRSTSSGGPYTPVNAAAFATSSYVDTGVTNGVTYSYVVTAIDESGNESAHSAEASATPAATPTGIVPWINEFHYDNGGKDKNEKIEVAGAAGTDLSGWQLLGYNGSNGAVYLTIALSGTLPDQQNGYGTLSFNARGLQNGSPDGIALVDDTGVVVEFISYEGAFTATSGPAAGLTSTDIGVSESSGASKTASLQRTGTGSQASDFSWQPPQGATAGQPNAGQTFQ